MTIPDIKTITDRDKIGDWLNANNLNGAAAEIGVMHGGYARQVLSRWKGRRYFMVDPWIKQPDDVYREKTSDIDYDSKYLECVEIAKRDKRVVIIRDFSVNAAKEIADGSLDFVWIDANHAYEFVTSDMDAWFPKVRSGGLFAGHDFYNQTDWPHYCEVERAVIDWMEKRNLKYHVTPDTGWWSIKP